MSEGKREAPGLFGNLMSRLSKKMKKENQMTPEEEYKQWKADFDKDMAEYDEQFTKGMALAEQIDNRIVSLVQENEDLRAQVKHWEDKEVRRASNCCGFEQEAKKLKEIIKEISQIVAWRHCYDKWHSNYKKHIGDVIDIIAKNQEVLK